MKTVKMPGMIACAVMTSLLIAGGAHGADQILLSAFSGAQTTESFEGFVAGPNIVESSFGPHYLLPGSSSTFSFGSGVSLTAPIPNETSNGAFLGNFLLGPASWGVSPNGVVSSANDVPTGTAYLGRNSNSSLIEFTFLTPQTRVGAFVIASSATITMEAFDIGGLSLGTAVVSAVPVADWELNFLGLEDATGIARVTISGSILALDDLVFEIGEVPSVGCAGDADSNGTVDFDDITSVLSNWLNTCP